MIRVESEETQDYVREAKSAEQEEVEELSFVPCAASVPQTMIFRCDNQYSEKTLSFWQSGVRGDTGRWGIIHHQLTPEMLQQVSEGQRRTTVDKCAVETGRGEKGVPWKDL